MSSQPREGNAKVPEGHFQKDNLQPQATPDEQKRKILNQISRAKYRLRQLTKAQVCGLFRSLGMGFWEESLPKDVHGCPNESKSSVDLGQGLVTTGLGKDPAWSGQRTRPAFQAESPRNSKVSR